MFSKQKSGSSFFSRAKNTFEQFNGRDSSSLYNYGLQTHLLPTFHKPKNALLPHIAQASA